MSTTDLDLKVGSKQNIRWEIHFRDQTDQTFRKLDIGIYLKFGFCYLLISTFAKKGKKITLSGTYSPAAPYTNFFEYNLRVSPRMIMNSVSASQRL